jgi:MtN3 and saliva related transmembrane protein
VLTGVNIGDYADGENTLADAVCAMTFLDRPFPIVQKEVVCSNFGKNMLEISMGWVSSEVSAKTNFTIFYERYMVVMGILGQMLFYIQGVKIFVTKSANDVSFVGFCLGLISVFSWLIYGMLIKNRVLILSNIFAVIGALFVVLGILIYGD